MNQHKDHFLDPKNLIALVILLASWLFWQAYMKKKYPAQNQQISQQNQQKQEQIKETPIKQNTKSVWIKRKHKEKTLWFKGSNMEILFSSRGLGIKQLKLIQYKDRKKEQMVFQDTENLLFANSFFKETESKIPFRIKKEGNTIVGKFFSSQGSIIKKIIIDDKNFILKNQIEIHPQAGKDFQGLSFSFSHPIPKEEKTGLLKMFFLYGQEMLKTFISYEGTQEKRLTKKDIERPQDFLNVNVTALGGKFFGKAFINKSSFLPSVIIQKEGERAQARIDYKFLHTKQQNLEYLVFLGPKSLKNFQKLGGEIRQWLDFGFFSWLARPLLLFLNWLYSWCSNWGLAIIFLTLFIRLCLLPINIKSYKSMKLMQKLQPQIKEIKTKYKSDPKQQNLKVMALMKENKANPLGGCLPLFIQFPVFFALYRVLGESIELYQAPFIFWIQDLSSKDPFFVLPILGGLVLFAQQKLTPMNLPKQQARLLTFMPLLFSVFMLALPSGLTLYIFVSGLFGFVQQFFFVKQK